MAAAVRREQDLGFQLVQSLYALAEGGVIGPGLGNGYLVRDDGGFTVPVLPTDFIFTAVATELGYVGGIALLLGFLLLLQRGFAIAAGAGDGFSKLLAAGLTAAVGLQALLIVGGIVRLIPLTGVTLPFVSYGGSSVLVNFGLVALLLVISHRSKVGARSSRRRRGERRRHGRRGGVLVNRSTSGCSWCGGRLRPGRGDARSWWQVVHAGALRDRGGNPQTLQADRRSTAAASSRPTASCWPPAARARADGRLVYQRVYPSRRSRRTPSATPPREG